MLKEAEVEVDHVYGVDDAVRAMTEITFTFNGHGAHGVRRERTRSCT